MSLTKFKIMGMVLALGAATTLSAQAADKARVRGVVESLSGDTLTVKSREGKDVTIKLKSGWAVNGIVNASVTDIKPGDFVGIASVPTDSGINGALEVLIFPAAMKGTGEGDYGWDLKPKSSMTNATVASAVTSVNGPTLSLTYKGGEKKISIRRARRSSPLARRRRTTSSPAQESSLTARQMETIRLNPTVSWSA